MGACCGKSDRKDQGHVLGSLSSATNTTNTTTTTTTTTKTTTTSTTKPKPSKQAGGQSLGAGPQSPTHKPGEMSALAAQQRAEAAEKRGVQQGRGQLAKKLAAEKRQPANAIEESIPERNRDWD